MSIIAITIEFEQTTGTMDVTKLVKLACEARESAYAPYSKFRVGAALLSVDGRVFTGANVENISYGLTICAERVAIFSAVASGAIEFSDLAVVSDSCELISPCGACRQVMAEFNPDLRVISGDCSGNYTEQKLSVLLPKPKTGILQSST
jgi:cytidine deaminase